MFEAISWQKAAAKLAALLRVAGYDVRALPQEKRKLAFRLAERTRIELPRPGVAWTC
ncbi:MAG TPA: hypothetical protein VEB64_09425 [Azospirillaceae bacterium]|nr:hypothetical protein [Azospirillaceae bacterium]